MEPRLLLLVGLGGAFGAMLRYGVNELLSGSFPWGTLLVNSVGSLLLGCIVGAALSPEMGLLFGTGVMGAFTTMSAYSVDLIELLESGQHGPAAGYLIATLLGCPLLAWGGMRAVQAF